MFGIKVFAGALAVCLSIINAAYAETVTGEVAADNVFMINISYGPGQTTTVVPPAGGWQTATPVSFEIDTTQLDTCTIQIVAWNVGWDWFFNPAGVQGYLTGNAGTVATGTGAFLHYDTGVSVPATLTNADFEAWIAAGGQPPVPPSSFNTLWWGSNAVFSNTPDGIGMEWIQLNPVSGSNTPIYNSFTVPCRAVVMHVENPLDDDHFACYIPIKLQEPSEEVALEIRDQFGPGEIKIGRPVLHCNPSEKIHDGVEFRTYNRERHLVCYEILEQSEIKTPHVRIENQIGTNNYVFENRREIFCVPSLKQEL